MSFRTHFFKQARTIPLFLLLCGLLLTSCSQTEAMPPISDYDHTLATTWFDLYLTLFQETEGFTPPVVSRAMGYAGVTLYEAAIPGMPEYQSLTGQLNELTNLPQPDPDASYHWPTVANSHSVQTGAAMQILTSMFGNNYAITDRTHERLGIPARSFDSFFDLANETAFSRLYGGIHYRAGILRGVDEGKCIANQVLELEFKKRAE